MKTNFMRPVVVAAVLLALGLTSASIVAAHTPITGVAWDNPARPSSVIATAPDEISFAPGDFYLRVLNSAGARVDTNNARVINNNTQITVSVQPNLPAGQYRVEWKTVGRDGEADTGTLNLSLAAPASPASPQMPATTMPGMAMPDAPGHVDQAGSVAHQPETQMAMPTGPVTFEATLLGANIKPSAVNSPAAARSRFTFTPATRRLDYTVWVHGVSADQITGLHIHEGGANDVGPHAHGLEILATGPTQNLIFAGSYTLMPEQVTELLAGSLYLQLHTKEYPSGAARAQLTLPPTSGGVALHRDGDDDHGMPGNMAPSGVTLRPPATGDAGLAAGS